MSKRDTSIYTALGGRYKKYSAIGIDGSGRDRGSHEYFDTKKELDEYVKELGGMGKFVRIYTYVREGTVPKKGNVLVRQPEYRTLKEYRLTSRGWSTAIKGKFPE